jgi:c-di-GMP-binding flagellar brake protein YcgR
MCPPEDEREREPREPRNPGSTKWRPRAPRANLVHAATCRFADEPTSIEVTSVNISQSGMLVRTPVVPPVGSQLEFAFAVENGLELIRGTGTVVRQASDGSYPTIGIAFADIDPARRRILARVIELNSEGAGTV